MAVARMRLLSNQTTREVALATSVSQARVVQAGMVLQYAPELWRETRVPNRCSPARAWTGRHLPRRLVT